ncbi:hypothetical protein BKA62DRAFT_45622 [Auriculariales sp. MPI-PUGE-AT-0066]|nr:hypothetical protein BKA62DRAFT_45622 [Auriculariales sp. MPI-PUGE-AT-0066]
MAARKPIKPGFICDAPRGHSVTASYPMLYASSTSFSRSGSPPPRPLAGIMGPRPPPPQGVVTSHVSPPARSRSPQRASTVRVGRKSTISPLRTPAPSRPVSPGLGRSANQKLPTRSSSPSSTQALSSRLKSPSPTRPASSHSTSPGFVISSRSASPALTASSVQRQRTLSSHPLENSGSASYVAAEINAHEHSPVINTSIAEALRSASIPTLVPTAKDIENSTSRPPLHTGFRDGVLPLGLPTDVCLFCCVKSKREGFQFCSDECTNLVAAEPLPQLLRVPTGHTMEKHLKKRLAERWYKPGRVPQVESIHMITWPNIMRASFEHYRDATVELRKLPNEPSELKFFTWEVRKCRLGQDGKREPCKSPACHICQAIVTGFKSTLLRNRQLAKDGLRLDVPFGGGIYMTPCASRAFWSAKQHDVSNSDTLALLVTRTVPGKKNHVRRPDYKMTNAGKGFDSVHSGNIDSDQEELVVYNDDAVRPAYLMILKQ